jgi:hypothetical protein
MGHVLSASYWFAWYCHPSFHFNTGGPKPGPVHFSAGLPRHETVLSYRVTGHAHGQGRKMNSTGVACSPTARRVTHYLFFSLLLVCLVLVILVPFQYRRPKTGPGPFFRRSTAPRDHHTTNFCVSPCHRSLFSSSLLLVFKARSTPSPASSPVSAPPPLSLYTPTHHRPAAGPRPRRTLHSPYPAARCSVLFPPANRR